MVFLAFFVPISYVSAILQLSAVSGQIGEILEESLISFKRSHLYVPCIVDRSAHS